MNCSRRRFTSAAHARIRPSFASTAVPSRTRCSRVSSSATCAVRSRARCATGPADSRSPTAARSFWTRSGTFRSTPTCRRSHLRPCRCSRVTGDQSDNPYIASARPQDHIAKATPAHRILTGASGVYPSGEFGLKELADHAICTAIAFRAPRSPLDPPRHRLVDGTRLHVLGRPSGDRFAGAVRGSTRPPSCIALGPTWLARAYARYADSP